MAGELFKAMAGVDIVHVPYKGSSGARTDILGGQVQMMFDAITTMARTRSAGKRQGARHHRQGALVGAARRADGRRSRRARLRGGDLARHHGARGHAPGDRRALNAEITKIVSRPEVREEWARQGAVPMAMTPDEFARYLSDDIAKWARIVKISGAKADHDELAQREAVGRCTLTSRGAPRRGWSARWSEDFRAAHRREVAGTFSAVGAMREKLARRRAMRHRHPDRAQVAELAAPGACCPAPRAARRRAHRRRSARGEPCPTSPTGRLRATLLAARGIYFPTRSATAGIHFMKVLAGWASTTRSRRASCRFPNGATAMRELARQGRGPVGCTQITEIRYTPGVALVGPLPPEFELATVYTAAVAADARQPMAGGVLRRRRRARGRRSTRRARWILMRTRVPRAAMRRDPIRPPCALFSPSSVPAGATPRRQQRHDRRQATIS